MAYLVLDTSNKVHLLNKSFACTRDELRQEIAKELNLKYADISKVNVYGLEAANILLETINKKGLERHCLIQAIFFGITEKVSKQMAEAQEYIEANGLDD